MTREVEGIVGEVRRGWTNKANLQGGRVSRPVMLTWTICCRSEGAQHTSLLNLGPGWAW